MSSDWPIFQNLRDTSTWQDSD